jgi:hypothetical protein
MAVIDGAEFLRAPQTVEVDALASIATALASGAEWRLACQTMIDQASATGTGTVEVRKVGVRSS